MTRCDAIKSFVGLFYEGSDQNFGLSVPVVNTKEDTFVTVIHVPHEVQPNKNFNYTYFLR